VEEIMHRRIPVFFGARYYTPINVYVEGGFEISYDKAESTYTGPLYGIYGYGSSASNEKTSFGISPGMGIEIPIGDNFLAGLHARYHLMINPYSTFGATVGYRF